MKKLLYIFIFAILILVTIVFLMGREQLLPKKTAEFTAGPGDYNFSLVHGGLARKYIVHIPPSYEKSKPAPVILAFHGGGGSIKAAYKDGIDKAADKFGFVLVIPAGTGPIPDRLLTWNGGKWPAGKGGFGFESCCGYAAKNKIDDVGFISKMIEELRNNFNVDTKRIYATGISNGGIMSYRLACELSDKIAAIAPVAPPAVPANCSPLRPVPVMHVHGTADPCAPYNGGTGGGCFGSEKYEMQSAKEMVDIWKEINKCPGGSIIAYQKGDVTCISYNKCADNSEVEFCTAEGMGHTWPSGSQYLPANRIGPVSYDISFEQIWEFFKRHPKESLPLTSQVTIGPGDYDFSIFHDGLTRVYSVHVPPSYNAKNPTPAIIAIHGGGSNVNSMRSFALMDKTSDKEGFIVIYPQATGPKVAGKTIGSWNAGRCCPEAMNKDIDDVGFISKLLDEIKTKFNIDPKRIFATGHSNGSQMAFRLACELSDKIAAIAPAGAQGVFDNCSPKCPVPVMYFHGTADPCSSYHGGTAGGCFQSILNELLGTRKEPYNWQVESVSDYIKNWVNWNQAPQNSKITYQKGNATCQTWGENTEGEVVLCTIQGMGHTWPGAGTYGDPCKFPNSRFCQIFKDAVGPLDNDISANDAMWEFFKKHPME